MVKGRGSENEEEGCRAVVPDCRPSSSTNRSLTMALAVAVGILFATLALTLMTMLSDNPRDNVSNVPIAIFTVGTVLSIAVGASYWM